DAFERGARQSFVGAQIEMGLDLARAIGGALLQMRIERKRIDKIAGIHHLERIENFLELAKRLDEFRIENFRQQFRARQPVAMLTRKRAAKLGDRFGQLLHGKAKLGDALRACEIEIDAAVDASFAEVAVVSADLQVVLGENLREAP